jgi:hypothetical protein
MKKISKYIIKFLFLCVMLPLSGLIMVFMSPLYIVYELMYLYYRFIKKNNKVEANDKTHKKLTDILK